MKLLKMDLNNDLSQHEDKSGKCINLASCTIVQGAVDTSEKLIQRKFEDEWCEDS